MHSLDPAYLEQLFFDSNQMATLRKIGECRGRQDLYYAQTPQILESLQQVASIESSESSNRLEGIIVPHKRIEELVAKKSKPKNRSEQEVAGYRDGLSLIHKSGKEMEFKSTVIQQLHHTISQYIPNPGGKWKMTDNDIIEKRPDGTVVVRFKPVSAYLTPVAMGELCTRYKKAIDSEVYDPMVLLPLAVFDFLCIHPFTDGNGRISRLLTLMLLYHHEYEVGRYISLERIFEESKESYYETLQKSSQKWHKGKHNVMPWMNYFWGVILRAYSEFEERVGTVKKGRGWKADMIRQAVERRNLPFAISDIEKECGAASRDMIRLVLRQLRDEGVIKKIGKGRGAKWTKES